MTFPGTSRDARPGRPRRRDRHGRGLRGPLAPPEVPITRSRAEVFDDLVLDAVEHVETRWRDELAGVDFAVEEVPPVPGPDYYLDPGDPVPLSRLLPAIDDDPVRIVVYRRPIEARAGDPHGVADLVHDVVVEEVARFLGLDPEVVDPSDGDD